jgi:hypothetical protein
MAIEVFWIHFVGIRILGTGIIGMDVFGTDKRRHKKNFSHDGSLAV